MPFCRGQTSLGQLQTVRPNLSPFVLMGMLFFLALCVRFQQGGRVSRAGARAKQSNKALTP